MAENKKSFVAYADWKSTFGMLTDEEAGKLVKHLLAYVNDENPKIEDRIILMAFEPMKLQLKRDLDKYEVVKEKRSKAGLKSAEMRKQNSTDSTLVESVEQTSTNPTVNDTDTVNVNGTVTDILLGKETKIKNFDFRKNLMDFGFKEKLIDDWIKVRKTKRATNTETAFNKFIGEVQKANKDPNEILEICISKDWKGFQAEWLNNIQTQNFQNGKQQFANSTKTAYEFSVDRVIETYTGDS
ncbi:DUF6291 domain-containing protein [Flavobacterium sp.]|uniref:DUF6291 domain-containing protein n=1 Tax=Flavobacterium sp. TaxID=239 RepID=UPI00286E0DCB|nr:DUF6291 domain-containing protein [Flavobacterium sp.]